MIRIPKNKNKGSTRSYSPAVASSPCSYYYRLLIKVAATTGIIIFLTHHVFSSFPAHHNDGSGGSTTSTTIHHSYTMSGEEIKHMIQECPPERTLTVKKATSSSSLKDFINATLRSLSHASKDITGSNRPIEHLAKNYDKFKSIKKGFWAEFGVFNGATLIMAFNELSQQTKFNGGVIAGFDSFEGLPEQWRVGFNKGAFTSQYETVRSLVPNSVELYKGWFQDTIQDFKAKHTNVPAAVVHHDGDLFISTAITLQLLDDRIAPGTHMVFDELVGYPGFEGHEILALWLWMNQQGVSLCAMGHMGMIEDLSDWLNPQRDIYFTAQSAWFQVLSRDDGGDGEK